MLSDGFIVFVLACCGAWFAATIYGIVILFHGLCDRDRRETRRGAVWLFAPYGGLTAVAWGFGGAELASELLTSVVTGVYVCMVLAVVVLVAVTDLRDPSPDGPPARYNEVKRML